MKNTKLIFDRPIYIGMSVLDISKVFMFDFHYGTMKLKYKRKNKMKRGNKAEKIDRNKKKKEGQEWMKGEMKNREN